MRGHQPPRPPERDEHAVPAERATYTARLVPAHARKDAEAYGAAARLQQAGAVPDPLPRLLNPADAPRAPDAWRLPDGTPHADPILAARGWQARGGIYVRQPQAQIEAG